MKNLLTFFILFYICISSTYAEDRLLPTDQSRYVTVKFKQDGKSVYATLNNKSSYVVVAAKAVCWITYEFIDSRTGYHGTGNQPIPVDYKDLRLLPGKSAESYFEVEKNVSECSIAEVRGREKAIYELF